METWIANFDDVLNKFYGKSTIHFVPFGNPIRRDDAVGIYIVHKLMKIIKNKRIVGLKIHLARNNIDSIFSKIQHNDLVIIFDAIRADIEPGSIIFTSLNSAKYGLFGTHNIPLKIMFDFKLLPEKSYILGVVPYDLGIGKGLSPYIKNIADEIVKILYKKIGDRNNE